MLGSRRLLVLSLLLVVCSGCSSLCRRAKWRQPVFARPLAENKASGLESFYARGLTRESDGDARCVDDFFHAAIMAWPDVEQRVLEQGKPCGRVGDVYHSCVTKLISAGTRFGRLDPKRGLHVHTAGGCVTIPTAYHGFSRPGDEFDHLFPVGDYSSKDLNKSYRYCGLGVAAVAIHCRRPDESFEREQQTFAATVVLRSRGNDPSSQDGFVLDLFDPLRVSSMETAGTEVALKRDITAPLAYVLSNANRQYLRGFLQPGSTTENIGLFMVEPYQPGKIPVVFVHGLLSDPYTWANLANEIEARPKFLERYQIWGFEYATGAPFLSSAAMLRRQLHQVRTQVDPSGTDAALSQVVLVGHSMGGLVSKLQVTQSGDELWKSVSCRPFPNLVTTDETREQLSESFFFEATPMVSRVIFIGTPHRGSPWARRPIGRCGAKLVKEPDELKKKHQQLLRDNPNAFSDEFTERIPTSIDLLEPESPLLSAINRLQHAPDVQSHTIKGGGYWMCGAGSSDTIVPESSARQSGVTTEKTIKVKHSQLHNDPRGISEVLCILRRHLHEVDAERTGRELHMVSWANESMIDRLQSARKGQTAQGPFLIGR